MPAPFAYRLIIGLASLWIAAAASDRLLAQDLSSPAPPSAPASDGPSTDTESPSDSDAVAHDKQQTAILNQLAANLTDAVSRHKAHLQEKIEWEAKLENLASQGLGEPPPYSFLTLDKARDELTAERQNAAAMAEAVARAKQAVADSPGSNDIQLAASCATRGTPAMLPTLEDSDEPSRRSIIMSAETAS